MGVQVDSSVRKAVLKFHTESAWVLGNEPDAVFARTATTTHSVVPDAISEGCFDFPLSPVPGPIQQLEKSVSIGPTRLPSADSFVKGQTISSKQIATLMHSSFGAQQNGHRPYASAGGLYPVGVFFLGLSAVGRNDTFSGAHYYHASSHSFEAICEDEIDPVEFGFSDDNRGLISNAAFALVYVLQLDVALFKYRYRGYRHGMIEAGAMSHQASLCASAMGFSSRPWSGFSDYQLSKNLNLNPAIAVPLLTQIFGQS